MSICRVNKFANCFGLDFFSKVFVSKMPEFNKTLPSVLEDNLKESNNLIAHLKGEIKQLMSILQEKREALQVKKIKEDNERLQREVNLVKNELIKLQFANGVKLIPVPGEEGESNKQPPLTSSKPVETVKEPTAPSNTSQVASCTDVNEIKQAKAPKQKKAAPPPADEPSVDIGRLDIRVGHILSAKVHPDADQLYVETIDVGEQTTRTVVSGLVKHIPMAELEKRNVLVLCNLKPQKMRGILSEAMVLCASTPEKVELLNPPPDVKAGDKVTVPGYTRNPDLPFMNPKKKIFEKVVEDLKVDSEKRASYKNVPWEIEGKPGAIIAQTLSGCNIK